MIDRLVVTFFSRTLLYTMYIVVRFPGKRCLSFDHRDDYIAHFVFF